MTREKIILILMLSLWSAFKPAPFKRPIQGNQIIRSEVRTPGMFTAINIHTPAKLVVKLQRMPKVDVRIDTNLMRRLRTDIEGETLNIYADGWINPSITPVIHVDVPLLNAITTSGYGDYVIEGIDNERFEIDHGVGRLKVTGTTKELWVSQGKGQLDVSELPAQRGHFDIGSWGQAHVHISEYLTASFSGRGTLIYEGSPQLSVQGEYGTVLSRQEVDTTQGQRTPITIPIRMVNNRFGRTILEIEGPAGKPFGYGLEMGPFFRKSETYPSGTRIYRIVQGHPKKLLHEVSEADRNQTIRLFKRQPAKP